MTGRGKGGGGCERGVWGDGMGLEGWWSFIMVKDSLFFEGSYSSV